jgi:hypothetical protein
MSSSGWMEESNFTEWFRTIFVPSVTDLLATGPVVLLMDGHSSHYSLQLIEYAKSVGVILYCLPPRTTHVLQPFDVGVFGPAKAHWKLLLQQHKQQTKAARVDKSTFPHLVAELWKKLLPEYLVSGFHEAGIYPLTSEAIPPYKLQPSIPFQQQQQQTGTTQMLPGPYQSPLQCKIRSFFAQIFAPKEGHQGEREKSKERRLLPSRSGEVLTADDFVEKLKKKAAEKHKRQAKHQAGQPKAKHRRTGNDHVSSSDCNEEDSFCSGCGSSYYIDNEEEKAGWIGCYNSELWCAELVKRVTSGVTRTA